MMAVDAPARRYLLRPAGDGFVAVSEPPLPDGTEQAERPSFELARAQARLWRLQYGGCIVEDRKRRGAAR